MPEMDGDQATKEVLFYEGKIKQMVREEGYQNCVVVGHSADDDEEVVRNFRKCGADFFEKKPPVAKNIKKILDKLMNL
jgi:hypothetical protein